MPDMNPFFSPNNQQQQPQQDQTPPWLRPDRNNASMTGGVNNMLKALLAGNDEFAKRQAAARSAAPGAGSPSPGGGVGPPLSLAPPGVGPGGGAGGGVPIAPGGPSAPPPPPPQPSANPFSAGGASPLPFGGVGGAQPGFALGMDSPFPQGTSPFTGGGGGYVPVPTFGGGGMPPAPGTEGLGPPPPMQPASSGSSVTPFSWGGRLNMNNTPPGAPPPMISSMGGADPMAMALSSPPPDYISKFGYKPGQETPESLSGMQAIASLSGGGSGFGGA